MRRVPNNISKGVSNSTRSKLKLTTLTTPLKYVPLTAKVNTTWNNVLNKNKVRALKRLPRLKIRKLNYFLRILISALRLRVQINVKTSYK